MLSALQALDNFQQSLYVYSGKFQNGGPIRWMDIQYNVR